MGSENEVDAVVPLFRAISSFIAVVAEEPRLANEFRGADGSGLLPLGTQ